MQTTLRVRFICSFKALGIGWFFSGLVFILVVHGPGQIEAWFLWGSAYFVVGWIVVGLPLIGWGDPVLRIPHLWLTLAGGLGGALVMILPPLIFAMFTGGRLNFSSNLLWSFGLAAFFIAAATTVLYRVFLGQSIVSSQNESS